MDTPGYYIANSNLYIIAREGGSNSIDSSWYLYYTLDGKFIIESEGWQWYDYGEWIPVYFPEGEGMRIVKYGVNEMRIENFKDTDEYLAKTLIRFEAVD